MAMGGAYAAGAGMVQKEESYVPLMRSYTDMARVTSPTSGGMGSRPSYGRRGGGGSSAATEIQRRKLRMEEQEAERTRQAEWSRRNQYMAAHHGREPTPEEMAEVQYGREKEEKGLIREEKGRQFDEMRAWKKEEAGRRTREFDAMRASEAKGSGLKERDVRMKEEMQRRKIKKEEREISKEDRIQDHKDMIQAWANRDYETVEEWFKRSGKGDEAPMFGPTDDPNMVEVKWPGQLESETVSRDMLGERFLQLGSGYGKPEKGKEMSRKEAENVAHQYAKQASRDDPDLYEEIYEEKLKEGTKSGMQEKQPKARGKIFKQKAASLLKQIQDTTGQKIIRARTNPKTGEMELTFEGGRKETVRVD